MFTVYDWKEYRPISFDENIEWHIGTLTPSQSRIIKNILKDCLQQNIKYL